MEKEDLEEEIRYSVNYYTCKDRHAHDHNYAHCKYTYACTHTHTHVSKHTHYVIQSILVY